MRDMLERFLIARPRNKELLGYRPFFFGIFRRSLLWERYREIFRLVATLAFSSWS